MLSPNLVLVNLIHFSLLTVSEVHIPAAIYWLFWSKIFALTVYPVFVAFFPPQISSLKNTPSNSSAYSFPVYFFMHQKITALLEKKKKKKEMKEKKKARK